MGYPEVYITRFYMSIYFIIFIYELQDDFIDFIEVVKQLLIKWKLITNLLEVINNILSQIMISIVFVVSFLSQVFSEEINQQYCYDDFYIQFGRNYTGEQRSQHEQIFNQNYADLLQRRSNGEDLEVTDFLDWNTTQRNDFFNYRPEQYASASSPPQFLGSGLGLSPDSVDWRALGRVTDIKNQGSCGSCWAFASTGQYESLIAIATNGTKYNLAEQYGLQCDRSSSGCNGGYPLYTLKLFNSSGGIPPQSSYPYMANSVYYTNQNKPICTDTNKIKLDKPITKITHYTTLTIEQIQQYLASNGPLTVGVYANHNGFMNVGISGKVSCPANTTYSIDHAILLVGYNSTHWIIKNSWGTSWGANGFGYIDKVNDCRLRSWVDVVEVDYGYVPNTNNNTSNTTNNSTNNTTNNSTNNSTNNRTNNSTNNNTNNSTNNSTNNNTNNNTVVNINLTITMTDSKGDGWNGNVLAVKQNNVVLGLFGLNFTSGSTYAPVYITINSKYQTVIIVYAKGSMTSEIGFTIKLPNGTLIYQRVPGQPFFRETIFKIFCPSTACTISSTVDYYLTMIDSWGDGWNGNILVFNQNYSRTTFGEEMNYARTVGPIKVTFNRFVTTTVTVYVIGSWTEQIGFQLRTYDGLMVASRQPGTKFYANNILATFCPDCINLAPVSIVSDQEEPKQITPQDKTEQVKRAWLLITTIVFGITTGLLLIALIIVSIKYYQQKQLNKLSLKNISKFQANDSHTKIGSYSEKE